MFKPNLDLGKVIVENQHKYEDNNSKKKSYKWFGINKPGLHRIRVMPPYSAKGDFGKSVFHFFNMPTLDAGKPATHVCIEKTFPEKNMKCPIMEVIREIEYLSEGGKRFAFDAWKSNPSHRYYANVLVRSSTNFPEVDPKVIHIGNFPSGMKSWIWSKIMDPDWGDITDPYTGRDLKITRNDSSGKTSYDREVVPTSSPIITNTDEIEIFLKDLPDLDEVFSFPTEEHLEKIKVSAQLFRNRLLENFNLVGSAFSTGTSVQTPKQEQQVSVPTQPKVQPVQQPQPIQQKVEQPVQTTIDLPVVNTPPQPVQLNELTVVPEKRKSSVPSDAPECFANPSVFDPKKELCQICLYEIQCGKAIKDASNN